MKNDALHYSELVDQYGTEYIPYGVKLETVEWQEKRREIIERDSNKCTCCGGRATFPRPNSEKKWVHIAEWTEIIRKAKFVLDENSNVEEFWYDEACFCQSVCDVPTVLQVHHRYYIQGRLPWAYGAKAFQTLCAVCHQKLHDTERVKVYQALEGLFMEMDCQLCSRCNGAGYFPQYKNVNNGMCFKCEGARYTDIIL